MTPPDWARAWALVRRWLPVVVPLLAALGIAVGISVTDSDHDGRPDTLTIHFDGADPDRARDDTFTVPAVAVQHAQNQAETGLREAHDQSPTPAGTLPPGTPLAAQEWPGCRTRFVRNFSQRTAGLGGPQVIVWHQTVSHDGPGWAGQDALTAMANRPSAGVSWHFLIGGQDGLCTFSVPLELKAWTQSNANSVAVGIEVERFGDEPSYVTAAGEKTLLAVTRRIGSVLHIPMQKAIVRWKPGCVPVVVRRGILEHSDLGPCGGGHRDVTPWSTEALIAKAAAGVCSAKCLRARDLRSRHVANHRRLERDCPNRKRSAACTTLRHKNTVLHRVARREGVKL